MLFHVRMTIMLPHDMPEEKVAELKEREKALAQQMQRAGKWRHVWRVAGNYANVSIFDVDSATELHELLTTLPLFPYIRIEVTALCRHGSSIRDDDR